MGPRPHNVSNYHHVCHIALTSESGAAEGGGEGGALILLVVFPPFGADVFFCSSVILWRSIRTTKRSNGPALIFVTGDATISNSSPQRPFAFRLSLQRLLSTLESHAKRFFLLDL